MADLRPLVAGNWKMNGLKSSLSELVAIRDELLAMKTIEPVRVAEVVAKVRAEYPDEFPAPPEGA